MSGPLKPRFRDLHAVGYPFQGTPKKGELTAVMYRISSLAALFSVSATLCFAQDAPADPKAHTVGKDGLSIEDQLTKDDPPLKVLKNAPHKVFLIRLAKGTTYQIDLKSKDFDSFLIVENDVGKPLAFDDDSGG